MYVAIYRYPDVTTNFWIEWSDTINFPWLNSFSEIWLTAEEIGQLLGGN